MVLQAACALKTNILLKIMVQKGGEFKLCNCTKIPILSGLWLQEISAMVLSTPNTLTIEATLSANQDSS